VEQPIASFVVVLVQDQPPILAQEFPVLSLHTNLMIRLRGQEKGATAVEYGIMVGLIAVVIIVAVSMLGTTLQDMFQNVQCSITGGKYTAGVDGALGSCAPKATTTGS
jgi:pilus assembly protein Flp/PilA